MLSDTTTTVDPVVAPVLLARDALVGSRYSIVAHRGSGGSSDVYQAVDTVTGSNVAVKLVRDTGAKSAARFARELAVAETIDHPNVVRVTGSGSHDGRPYLVMEWIEGPNLAERLRERPLTVDEAVTVATQTLNGLAALHDRGVVHRDIKPSNLLLSDSGVKIADLGLAKHQESATLTSTNAAVGTWAYIAPEQALSQAVDHRADLFSLGVLLYECLAGRIPYADRDTVSTVVSRLHHRPRPVTEYRPDTPAWLSDIVMRLLARDPEERFRDARSALHAIASKRVRRPWLALVVTAFLCIGATLEHPTASRVQITAEGVNVLDARSRILWSVRGRRNIGLCAAIVHDRDRIPRYIAIAEQNVVAPSEVRSRVGLYDPLTGKMLKTLVLPRLIYMTFGGFSDLYSLAQLTSVNAEGADLLALTYLHEVYYPSYTIVWDFDAEAPRVVFYSAGHHRVIGAKDVNHDGRRDLLIIAIANKLGWYAAVGAVDLPPVAFAANPAIAQTPDRTASEDPRQSLLWFKILPPAWVGVENAAITERGIEVHYPDGRMFEISDSGFLSDRGDLRARQKARTSAYDMLARATRASGSRDYAAAAQLTESAVASALASGDETLTQWAKRQHAVALIATGEDRKATELAESVVQDATIDADACYDFARAFHLRHDNDRAVEWYTRSLRARQPVSTGRIRSEALENAVFALVEKAEWHRARELIAEYRQNFSPRPADADVMRTFVDWREQGTPPSITGHPNDVDFVGYLRVVSAQLTRDPREALSLAAAEAGAHRSFDGLVRLVYADLLRKTGKTSEAAAESAAACNWLVEHADDPLVRAMHATCAQ